MNCLECNNPLDHDFKLFPDMCSKCIEKKFEGFKILKWSGTKMKDETEKLIKEEFERKIELIRLSNSFENSKITLNRLERDIYLLVSLEKDEKGKNIFSNEAIRKVETENRLEKNSAWGILQKEHNSIKIGLEEKKADIERIQRLIRLYTAVITGGN